jgi:hypothetical protein
VCDVSDTQRSERSRFIITTGVEIRQDTQGKKLCYSKGALESVDIEDGYHIQSRIEIENQFQRLFFLPTSNVGIISVKKGGLSRYTFGEARAREPLHR